VTLSGIFDAIHRRNYRICTETLLKVSRYRDRGALILETRKLFTLQVTHSQRLCNYFRAFIDRMNNLKHMQILNILTISA